MLYIHTFFIAPKCITQKYISSLDFNEHRLPTEISYHGDMLEGVRITTKSTEFIFHVKVFFIS